jgi:hypothetical protein
MRPPPPRRPLPPPPPRRRAASPPEPPPEGDDGPFDLPPPESGVPAAESAPVKPISEAPLSKELFFQDIHARPCDPKAAALWTYAGAPTWYRPCAHPRAALFRYGPRVAEMCPDCGLDLRGKWVPRKESGDPSCLPPWPGSATGASPKARGSSAAPAQPGKSALPDSSGTSPRLRTSTKYASRLVSGREAEE